MIVPIQVILKCVSLKCVSLHLTGWRNQHVIIMHGMALSVNFLGQCTMSFMEKNYKMSLWLVPWFVQVKIGTKKLPFFATVGYF